MDAADWSSLFLMLTVSGIVVAGMLILVGWELYSSWRQDRALEQWLHDTEKESRRR